MTTTHSLARLMFTTRRYLDEAEASDSTSEGMTAARDTLRTRMERLRRLASLCRRACGLARLDGTAVVLVAPVGTSPDEVAGGLADEGAGRERVEVLCPTAEEWPAAYAAARQRAGVEVVS